MMMKIDDVRFFLLVESVVLLFVLAVVFFVTSVDSSLFSFAVLEFLTMVKLKIVWNRDRRITTTPSACATRRGGAQTL